MKFKEIIRTTEQVTEREFDGTLDEIMELFDYLCDNEMDINIEFGSDRWGL